MIILSLALNSFDKSTAGGTNVSNSAARRLTGWLEVFIEISPIPISYNYLWVGSCWRLSSSPHTLIQRNYASKISNLLSLHNLPLMIFNIKFLRNLYDFPNALIHKQHMVAL